ncbi:site-specific integrase [Rhizobium ruizarguesonis]
MIDVTFWPLDTALPTLPFTVTTRDGVVFDPRPDLWELSSLTRKRTYFDFGIFANLSLDVRRRLKLAMIWKLENSSFSYARNHYENFLAFYRSQFSLRNEPSDLVTLPDVLNYRGSLNFSTEWKLAVLRILLVDMQNTGIGIASGETVDYLKDSTIRGNVKGTSIRTRDREKGAFTDVELSSMQSALNNAYASGEIGIYTFALAWLFQGYGPRPIQLAALKESDLIISEAEGGKQYALRMPRAKQHGEEARTSFKTRYCSKQIGQLLEEVIRFNTDYRKVHGLNGQDWPMFMSEDEGKLAGLKHHVSSHDIGRRLIGLVGRVTGLKTNSRRFRITLAQRAVDDGKDKFTVAEMLDHSDTQNVEVYFEASPAMVLRLDRHLAMELAPLAQAFAGVVVNTEADALRGGDRSSRIYDRSLIDNVADPLGTCGQMSFCGLAVPFACYTCRHFQPWLDGPHEAFLAALIADRNRMKDDDLSPKIFTIRDKTILAVAEVIQLCSAEPEAREGGAA